MTLEVSKIRSLYEKPMPKEASKAVLMAETY